MLKCDVHTGLVAAALHALHNCCASTHTHNCYTTVALAHTHTIAALAASSADQDDVAAFPDHGLPVVRLVTFTSEGAAPGALCYIVGAVMVG